MAFVQKVEKKSDLDDMMNEVQEKFKKKMPSSLFS